MKKLLTLLVAFCCLGSMNAQLVDVIVETFGTSVGTYPAGHTTYRVFARLQDPTDFMSAVYGIGAAPADPDHDLKILDNVLEAGSTTSWNTTFAGITGPDVNPAFCGIFPEVCFDSFLTIGRSSSASPGNAINVLTTPGGLFIPTFNTVAGTPCTVNDGAWFALSGDVNGLPTGLDNRVLLMQVTCPTGQLEFQINCQIFDNGNGANSLYYAHNLQGPMGVIGGVLEQDWTCQGLVVPQPPACLVNPGCIDITACNYDPTANFDDGSCTYPGCNDIAACNYDALAGCLLAGSCTYPGCTDALACNYAPAAGCDDGSCTYPGCTNAVACNYDAAAGCDDGSCCLANCVSIVVSTGSFPSEISWTLTDGLGGTVASGGATSTTDLCLVDDCYNFNGFDSFGDGWNGATYTINVNGSALYSGTITGSGETVSAGIPGVCGCMDPLACNYNALAVLDNGSCTYPSANDVCGGATPLTYGVPVADNNSCTPVDGPNPSCGGATMINDVWFSFVYNGGNVSVETTLGTLTDTRIAVYGSCGGAQIACDDDDGVGFGSLLNFTCPAGLDGALTAGNTYFIQAGGFNAAVGGFSIVVTQTDIVGCCDPLAVNYDACANVCDNSGCSYTGCTNPAACNFDPGANTDDGSCCLTNCVTITVTPGSFASEVSWNLTDAGNNVVAAGGAPFSGEFCLPTGCYTLNESDSFGDGWNGSVFTASDTNGNSSGGTLESGSNGTDPITIGGAAGCLDVLACNYDALAICDNGTCEYTSCLGCTDPAACNFDAGATIEDGSCCSDNCLTLDLFDSFGDGWDTGVYTLSDALGNPIASGTLANGSVGQAEFCVVDGCYTLDVSGSFFDSEVSWTLNGADGGSISGGDPSGNIQFSVGGVDCFGCTDPTACNFEAGAAFDDGSCTYAPCIANDIPGGATALTVTPLGTCSPTTDDLTGASDSPESAASGPDLWYAITAVTPGLRIEVLDVNPQDIKIDLLDAALNAVDAENVVGGNGGEILNYGGLTTGATYYIAVSGNTGLFSICAQWIQDSQCDYGSGPYDLCATFKSNWIGAAGYAFEMTSISTLITYTYEKAAALQPSTFVKLNDVTGLTWADSYVVNCQAFYNLTNGAGIEKVYVDSDNQCTIVVNAAPTMVLRPSDNCANFGPHLLGQTVAGQPFVCTAVDYEWEFTRTDVAELPIYKLRGAANRFLHLLTVPGLTPGGVYDVRVRPIFSYGPGAWGAVSCLSIVGPVLGATQDGPVAEQMNNEERMDVNGMDAAIYPNPNTGSMININLTGVTSEMVSVDVRDQVGRVVFSAQYAVNNGSLNGVITFDKALAGGLYTMSFIMNGEVRSERFVVTR